jgi:hypothetical protein
MQRSFSWKKNSSHENHHQKNFIINKITLMDLINKIIELNSAGITVTFRETKPDIDHPRLLVIQLLDPYTNKKRQLRLDGSDFAIVEKHPEHLVEMIDSMYKSLYETKKPL